MLLLLEGPEVPEPEWKLDEETKERGRRNVAKARAVLAAARKEALVKRQSAAGSDRHAA